MNPGLTFLSSSVASSLRLWRGTWGDRPARAPEKLLTLYDQEDSGECRLVREVLTELNLDVMVYPCPAGGKRFAPQRKKLAPALAHLPLLHDPNNGATLAGAERIIAHLYECYLDLPSKPASQVSSVSLLAAQLAGRVRNPLGINAQPSSRPKRPLTLYSFESSPFSRPVREKLCALELPYHLINLGKLQWADMGPPRPRSQAMGLYPPTPGSKRAIFFKEHGKVQVPYLIDPNHDVAMFESNAILDYLDKTYAKS